MFILFDIGGTKTRLASSIDGVRIDEALSFSTPSDFYDGTSLLIEKISSLLRGELPRSIIGGVPGPLDKNKTTLISAPNLPLWIQKPFRATLEKNFAVPIILENDAVLAGLGEAKFGGGKGKKIISYLTISTGVGGVRIINGKVDLNEMGFEPGHQIIQKDGYECIGCKQKGHLEAHIGGASLYKRYNLRPEEITDDKIWEEIIYDLSVGLTNVSVFWSPDVIILGGSLMKKIKIEKVQKNVSELLKIYDKIPEIRHAELGDLAGIHGALTLIPLNAS